jgi:hypothetical protein
VLSSTSIAAINSERVLVACVAEDRPRDGREVLLMFHSLLRLGGGLAHCRRIAFFVDHVDTRLSRQLFSIGVETRVVGRVDVRCPHANKIRMLMDIGDDTDWVVALDTDVAVAGDISRHLAGANVRAKPVDSDPLSMPQWSSLFDRFALEPPPERYLTTFDRRETIAYFNSGVLIVPGVLATHLAAEWTSFVKSVIGVYDELPAIAPHAFFTDQFALALALARRDIRVNPLPLEMNFPTHRPIHPCWQPDNAEPLLLHHHHRITEDGALLSCGYRGPDNAITAVNAATCAQEAG